MVMNLAVIPARGGSKRIPRKNITNFNGKPMIAWTIEAARQSGIFSHVLVSTEDEEIAQVAMSMGAEVPFLRTSFYDDITPVSVATCEALVQAEDHWGVEYDTVTQLMANCPLRTAKDIVSFHASFQNKNLDSLLSCFKFGWMNPWWAFRLDDSKNHSYLFPEARLERSQDHDDLFCPTGSIWLAKAKALKLSKSFYMERQGFEEIELRSAIDIDDMDDLEFARALAAVHRS